MSSRVLLLIIIDYYFSTVRDNADQNQDVSTRNGENIKE